MRIGIYDPDAWLQADGRLREERNRPPGPGLPAEGRSGTGARSNGRGRSFAAVEEQDCGNIVGVVTVVGDDPVSHKGTAVDADGKVFIGCTCAMAAFDAGLTMMVGGAIVGTIIYWRYRRQADRVVDKVVKDAKCWAEDQVAGEPDPERKRALRKEADAQLKQLDAKAAKNRLWADRGAGAIGLGCFANPVIGGVILVSDKSDAWMPIVVEIPAAIRDVQRKQQQEIQMVVHLG